MNMKRMNNSAQRIALPVCFHSSETNGATPLMHAQRFNGDEVIELMKQLIRLDKDWIPNVPGYSLYIRPTMSACRSCHPHPTCFSQLFSVGCQPAIGISPPSEALLFVICSPVGPYYPDGFKPVALYGTTEYSRAAPGGRCCSTA